MNWTDLLTAKIEETYGATLGLAKKAKDSELGFRPATGGNWMTLGQLLDHLTNAGGTCVKGFVTGDWGMPEGAEMTMPKAEDLPKAASVASAVAGIEADRRVALEMVRKAGEAALASKSVTAPWDPTPKPLGLQCLDMISGHLSTHKAQLFYYLKLLGHPVHTGDLYGM